MCCFVLFGIVLVIAVVIVTKQTRMHRSSDSRFLRRDGMGCGHLAIEMGEVGQVVRSAKGLEVAGF